MSNANMPIDPDAILAQLTLEEKIQLTSGMDIWRTCAIERVKLPYIKLTDGPIGARGGGDFNDSTPSTLYPSPSCLGATWDTKLAFEMGKQIALDSIEKQCHVVLGPTVNIQRDPRAGRFFESYSEDPYLMGIIASNWINGCQSTGVGATMKHFVGNEAETERTNSSSDLSVEALREVYLEPFRIIMANLKRTQESKQFSNQPVCVMTAYNRVNGISSSENGEMIDTVLRKEWGFDGLVMSDWFALHADGLHATDLEMPGPPVQRRVEKILERAKQDSSLAEHIDRCASKVLQLIRQVHSLGYQKSVSDEIEKSVPIEQVAPSIRQIGAEGAVLMKNENEILPIQLKKGLRIACIGQPWKNAVQSGGGSANLTAQKVMEPLSTFQQAIKQQQQDVKINHHPGVGIHNFTEKLRQPMKLEYFTGREIGKGEIVAKAIVKDATLGHSAEKPKEIPYNNYWVKGSIEIEAIKKDKEVRFGLLAFGTLTVYVTIDNDEKSQKVWKFEGESNFFDAMLNPYRVWQEEFLSLKAQRKVQLEIHYLPRIDQIGAPYGGFQIGMEEVENKEKVIQDAVQVSKESDVTIILTALGKDWESEGFDRPNLQLPRHQDEMVKEIIKSSVGKVIVLNLSGSVVDLPWIEGVSGLVQCWYGGQEGAESICDVLLGRGEAPASGKLPHVWPKNIKDHPSGKDVLHFPGKYLPDDTIGPHTEYFEGRLVGHRYYNKHLDENQPAFHFGQGIGGYTTFSTTFSKDFQKDSLKIDKNESLPFTIKVQTKNTGKRTGKEIAQIYVRPKASLTNAKDEPLQRLAGFAVLRPKPDQMEEAEINLYQEAFSFWDEKNKSWQVSKGEYEIILAKSARLDDKLDSLTLTITNSWTWKGLGL